MEMLGIGLDLMAILVTFCILVGVLLGKKNAMNEYFPILLLMNALTLMTNMGTLVFCGDGEMITLLKACWLLEMSFALVNVAGFNLYVDRLVSRVSVKHIPQRAIPFVIVAIVIVVCIVSMETGWIVSIDSNGEAKQGQFYYLVIITGVGIALFDAFQVILAQMDKRVEVTTAVGLYIFVSLPILALFARPVVGNQSLLFSAMTVSFLVMYMMVHIKQETRSVEQAAENEQMHTEMTISQLQPHFMFNTLTSIRYLCRSDAVLAEEAMGKFSTYLRRNLDYLDASDQLIEFRDELEHTKTYLWLEQLRFGKKLKVEYSIDVDDFLFPPLCLQPIVENAVKHGITKKVGGGKVTIQVRDIGNSYKIMVIDDGVGFDTNALARNENNDMENFSGINGVRKRINQINGSTLAVISNVGLGTSVTYEIKKDIV